MFSATAALPLLLLPLTTATATANTPSATRTSAAAPADQRDQVPTVTWKKTRHKYAVSTMDGTKVYQRQTTSTLLVKKAAAGMTVAVEFKTHGEWYQQGERLSVTSTTLRKRFKRMVTAMGTRKGAGVVPIRVTVRTVQGGKVARVVKKF